MGSEFGLWTLLSWKFLQPGEATLNDGLELGQLLSKACVAGVIQYGDHTFENEHQGGLK